jgi:hypothetical protein
MHTIRAIQAMGAMHTIGTVDTSEIAQIATLTTPTVTTTVTIVTIDTTQTIHNSSFLIVPILGTVGHSFFQPSEIAQPPLPAPPARADYLVFSGTAPRIGTIK